ncbi:unnamed protein product [Cutaneotrichosporon oleaginosum]
MLPALLFLATAAAHNLAAREKIDQPAPIVDTSEPIGNTTYIAFPQAHDWCASVFPDLPVRTYASHTRHDQLCPLGLGRVAQPQHPYSPGSPRWRCQHAPRPTGGERQR